MKLKSSIIILISLLAALCLSTAIYAEPIAGTLDSSELTYEINDGALTLAGNGEIPDFDISGAPWSELATTINEVIILDGVTAIGDNAFVNINVNEVPIPDTVHWSS
jgi:hypothetical protein